jgi:tRNA pseudouridine38-40 synthase
MRYACGLEYCGNGFYGFQTQVQEPTIQGCLEKALSKVANHSIRVHCCGRTDTGVSAILQVIHFDTETARTEYQWIMGVNSNLPQGISVLWVKPVEGDFHARFSAIERSYRYKIFNRWVRPAINRYELSWEMLPLNEQKMNQAVQYLIGKHDFNAFRSSACQSKTSIKTIYKASVSRNDNIVQLDISGSGFLHHMIRNIVGTLLPIGKGEKEINSMQQVLLSKDRKQAGVTAKPNGLTFYGVKYPERFAIPDSSIENHLEKHYER